MTNDSEERIFDVACVGHICLDIIPRIPDVGYHRMDEILRPGKLINVNEATINTGGPVANTGLACERLGAKVAFIAKVGDDEFGRIIRQKLETAGNVHGLKIQTQSSSSYSIVIAPPGIDRMFLHNPASNDTFTSNDIDFGLIRKSKLFHFGYPPIMRAVFEHEGEELKNIFRQAKKTGVTTSLDMSLPDPNSLSGRVNWRMILEKALPYVDIFLPSIEEAYFILNQKEFLEAHTKKAGPDFINSLKPELFTEFADEFIRMGCKMTVLKSAHRGIYFRSAPESRIMEMGACRPVELESWASRELWCPSFHIYKIASATGAGDAAIAGFLTALLRDVNVEDALKIASCVGYQNLHKLDAVSGIKSWDETHAILYKGNLKLNEFHIQSPGWYWEKDLEIWFGPNDIMIIK